MKDHEAFKPYRPEFRTVRFTKILYENIDVPHLLGVYPDKRDLLVLQSKVGSGHGDSEKLRALYGPIESTGLSRDVSEGQLRVRLAASEPLSEWAPTTSEVAVIVTLAKAVAPLKEKPLILDMECGTGLLAYSLARTGLVEIIGSEQETTWLEANSPYFKYPHLSFLNESGWETAKRYSSAYSIEDTEKRTKLIDEIHTAIEQCDQVFGEKISSSHFNEEWSKWVFKFHEKLAELRKISGRFIKESDIDLVVSSCAPAGFDPTIPIRDVIHPKAIFYVGESNIYQPSASGVTLMDIPMVELTGESYKPGRQYQEIAKWRTYCREDWQWFNSSVKDILYSKGLFRVGVSLQKRKDVQLSQIMPVQIESLPWERELLSVRNTPPPVEPLLALLS